jgi:hypothetical protein
VEHRRDVATVLAQELDIDHLSKQQVDEIDRDGVGGERLKDEAGAHCRKFDLSTHLYSICTDLDRERTLLMLLNHTKVLTSRRRTIMENLKNLRGAILVDDGFEEVELVEPWKALREAGAKIRIVSPKTDRVRGWNFTDWGHLTSVDVALDQARPDEFDALLLPGGVMNPDSLRIQPKAVAFVKAFFDAGKPVAIGPQATRSMILPRVRPV